MDFTGLAGFNIFWYLILMVIFFALMFMLVRSAASSLKRTGGKWTSVVDEVVIGIIVVAGFIMIGLQSPGTVINWIQVPLKWFWELLLGALRFVGVPI